MTVLTGSAPKVAQLDTRFPAGPPTPLDELIASVSTQPEDGRLRVGDERIGDFLAAFARRLLTPAVARRFPELGSLGFFLRRNEIARVASRLQEGPEGALVFPRGLVFHVPPANVDTIFVYSWALAALAGNHNIVRVSQRAGGAALAVLDALNDCLADAHPAVAQTQRMVTYGHEDAVTERLSAECDLRVVWGGDRSVTEVRRFPLRPSARDLTFPDRSSFAALSVAAWLAADGPARRAAVEGFANDAYWFDQGACASPRAVFLVGDAADSSVVRREFLALLADVVAARGWGVDPAMAVQQQVGSYGMAADGDATRIEFSDNAFVSLDLTGPEAAPRRWLGAGTFPFATLASLDELVPVIRRQDQTLAHFGFDRSDLIDFAAALGGRGLDRIVPFGSALSFSRVWDGYDLPAEFRRLVTVA